MNSKNFMKQTHRINLIFNRIAVNQKSSISDFAVSLQLFIYLLLWIVLLLFWTIYPSLQTQLVYISSPNTNSNGTITSYNVIPQCDYGVMK
jgi:hypothetical protein